MKYKLLVLDIDGTVTNSKKQITEKTRKCDFRIAKKRNSGGDCVRKSTSGNFILLPKHWNLINLEVILCLLMAPEL